jgi:hypothetical protein
MALLGDILGTARASAGAFQSWLVTSDPQLAREVSAVAAREGLTPAGFVRSAVADFSRLASEEDWATLVSSLRDSENPGTICLLAMVHWRLTVRGCSDHSFGKVSHEEGAEHERLESRSAG